jgi:hypothetical protein
MGGWMIMPGSCSSGFRSRPSAGTGNRRSKGLEVISVKSRKPTVIRPITPRMRATISKGRCRLKSATESIQPLSIMAHSSSEPS